MMIILSARFLYPKAYKEGGKSKVISAKRVRWPTVRQCSRERSLNEGIGSPAVQLPSAEQHLGGEVLLWGFSILFVNILED